MITRKAMALLKSRVLRHLLAGDLSHRAETVTDHTLCHEYIREIIIPVSHQRQERDYI